MHPRSALAHFFALFHVVAICAWSLPYYAPTKKRATAFLKPYMNLSGLWQDWDMFSPEPLSVNSHLEAEIFYRDGTMRRWEFPRMEHYGIWERYGKERYRKWAHDRVRLDSYSIIWPDTALFIARLNDRDPSNPPVNVKLHRFWENIPSPVPARSIASVRETYDKPHLQSRLFYEYSVPVALLGKAKAP